MRQHRMRTPYALIRRRQSWRESHFENSAVIGWTLSLSCGGWARISASIEKDRGAQDASKQVVGIPLWPLHAPKRYRGIV